MSTFKVPLLTITQIEHHPNADRLDLVIVADTPVVCGRDMYKVGDKVIYVPVDSVLPDAMVEKISAGSKIALKNRVKAAKIRGIISQGLVLNPKDWLSPGEIGFAATSIGDSQDYSTILGITKYEEEVKQINVASGVRRQKPGNPLFRYYTDIENIKHYPNIFVDGEPVWVSEKLHGTSFRAGWFPIQKHSLWNRIKAFFRFKIPTHEFCYGSRKVDISASSNYSGYYGIDLYGQCCNRLSLRDRVPVGYAVYGEIIGPGIQKNFTYGRKDPELFVYDILDTRTGQWLDVKEMLKKCQEWGLTPVPTLEFCPYDYQLIRDDFSEGKVSTLDPSTTREGVVIKPLTERIDNRVGRVVLKLINSHYLLKDTTEFH